MQPLPFALAVYIARSALRSRSSGLVAGSLAGGDADAGTGVHLPARHLDGRVEGVEDALGHLHHGSGIGGVLEQHGELVAAEAGGRVARTQAAPQAVGHGAEQLVARPVPEAVVDQLEVVEVDEGHGRDGGVGAADPGQRVLDPVEEQRPVGQSGEGVVEGLVAQLVLEGPPPGDVADGEHDAVDVGVVEEVDAHDLGVDHGVIRSHQLGVDGAHGLGRAVDELLEEPGDMGHRIWVQDPLERRRRRGRRRGNRAPGPPRGSGSGCDRPDPR